MPQQNHAASNENKMPQQNHTASNENKMPQQNHTIHILQQEKPEWIPKDAGVEFATVIVPGVSQSNTQNSSQNLRRQELTVDDYVNGIIHKNRTILGRAITLVESNSPKHFELAQSVLTKILPYTGNSLRVGISGPPGAGKSTFIETMGNHVLQNGKSLAVLAVDPSSSISKGSVLGDKTRMEKLVQNANCFIRPSPSGGALGGVARKTRETTLICEAAGYEVIFIETVGVGQSEVQVRSMVDFFLMIHIAGAGDELQGIKKGIMEIIDCIAINKCDGNNIMPSRLAQSEYQQALHYITPFTPTWKPNVYVCSAKTGFAIPEIWEEIQKFYKIIQASGYFQKRRQEQAKESVHQLIQEYILDMLYRNPTVVEMLSTMEMAVGLSDVSPTRAAQNIITAFLKEIGQKNL